MSKKFPGALGASYDQDAWELTVSLKGETYVFVDISPFQNGRFVELAEKNRGRAMGYIRGFKRKEEKDADR